MNYKHTINLPKTEMPMRANLSQRELNIEKFWDEGNIYQKMIEQRKGKVQFILHDGPPYSNGHIHLGQTLNKVLKDIVVKYKTLKGFYSPYVPGWDNHGMPIENIVIGEFGGKKDDIVGIRKRCREFAKEWVDKQKKEFKRLGVIGDWQHPYLTMDKFYEGQELKIFADIVEKGYVYRGHMPIHWCPHCQTALAIAEIEYKEIESPSLWFRMKGVDDDYYALVWTTTPWTIISNRALAFHPDYEYVVIEHNGDKYLLALPLLEKNMELLGWKDWKEIKRFSGKSLEGKEFQHPFLDRRSPGILAKFITMEEGTGIVHIAPGHGREDFEVGRRYGIEVYSPVDERGRFTEEAGETFQSLTTDEASEKVVEILKSTGNLLKIDKIQHQYPHCWRCKSPLIFRATDQWFLSVDRNNLREKALDKVKDVKWVPEESKNRISASVKERPDWCLSRQRVWGINIPAFYCKKCGTPLLDPDVIRYVSEIFLEEGGDAWYTKDVKELLPEGITCKECGSTEFEKENDILDVWFDSGISSLLVLQGREELEWPSNMYLEGPDQHRGWFNAALTVSMIEKGIPPYDTVITHGWVLDDEGKSMHKSIGNVISPLEIIEKYGADILRLWVASSDYTQDVKIGKEILERLVDSYRKIRNTFRFMLGNTYDFSEENKITYNELLPVDRYMLSIWELLKQSMDKFYNNYLFHKAFHRFYNFIISDLSAFYLDILKDRLYTYGKNSLERRSAQTVISKILKESVILFSPILSFTCEEVWQYLDKKEESVFLADFPEIDNSLIDERLNKDFEKILNVREDVLVALEKARNANIIGNSLEARLFISSDMEVLKKYQEYLSEMFIVSQLEFTDNPEADVIYEGETGKYGVTKAKGKKCERCWVYSETVGENREHPTLCRKCVDIIQKEDFSE